MTVSCMLRVSHVIPARVGTITCKKIIQSAVPNVFVIPTDQAQVAVIQLLEDVTVKLMSLVSSRDLHVFCSECLCDADGFSRYK